MGKLHFIVNGGVSSLCGKYTRPRTHNEGEKIKIKENDEDDRDEGGRRRESEMEKKNGMLYRKGREAMKIRAGAVAGKIVGDCKKKYCSPSFQT